MIIAPRKTASRSGVGMFGSLIAIVGGACAFLVMLQDYTQATMSRPVPRLDAATISYDQPLFVSAAEQACFQPAPPAVSSTLKRIILTQMLAVRTGDAQTAQKYVDVPAQGLCQLHLVAVLKSCTKIAGSRYFQIDRATISHDRDQAIVYCKFAGDGSHVEHATYTMSLDEIGEWRVQNIEIARHGDAPTMSFASLPNYPAPYATPRP